MEHLALEIFDLDGKGGSKYAYLPEDTSITITDTSEIFASGDVWSHSFTLNVHANAHIFGTSGEIHGSRLHEQINKRRARLWVEGLPLYLGYLKLDDEVEVDEDGNVDVTFESGQKTFDELIEGAKANQVPMLSDVRFGVALWRKRWTHVRLGLTAQPKFKDGKTSSLAPAVVVKHEHHITEIGDEDDELIPFMADGELDDNSVQQYPRMVFPKGEFKNANTSKTETINELNTDFPYTEDEDGTPTHPYCNVALCYQKYDYKHTDTAGREEWKYSEDPVAQRGYEYMPANRVNSAPNFFVLYWLRCLMKHLGIYIEENQMLDVEDLRRLFFVNTNCAYKEPKKLRTPGFDTQLGRYQFLDSKRYLAEYFGDKTSIRFGSKNFTGYNGQNKLIKTEDCGFSSSGVSEIKWTEKGTDQYGFPYERDRTSMVPAIESIAINVSSVVGMNDTAKEYYDRYNGWLHDAIATSDCFPDADISEVISAIESGFGVRFLFSDNYQRVRIVLLRNIFRDEEVQDIACDIISETKTENSIRGFRMTYGDNKEDTQFYYKGFADKLPHIKQLWPDDSDKHDYSHWNLDADYGKLINKVSAFDKTCYVDPTTGNAYIIKVDKDAKLVSELYASLFEGAGFMDAEDGDCTGEDNTIETINVGFAPAIMNDLNMESERKGNSGQRFALFVDANMRARRPDLGDLPNEEKQPGVKSYSDSDAVYDVDALYTKHGPNSDDKKTDGDSVVAPGSFAFTSDMSAARNGLSAVLTYTINTGYNFETMDWESISVSCPITFNISGHINEGYRLYLQDNYEPNDDGVAPVETHDWGLTLGIMRGSGSDAYVNYFADPDDGEENDTWDIVPGDSATAHHDTCDNYGKEWDYNVGDTPTLRVSTAEEAINALKVCWPKSNFDLVNRTSENYLTETIPIYYVEDDQGKEHTLLLAQSTAAGRLHHTYEIRNYVKNYLAGKSTSAMYTEDKSRWGILIETDSNTGRQYTLQILQNIAFAGVQQAITITGGEGGVGTRFGRFSLKLRAEKPNPYYVAGSTDDDKKNQYLSVQNENLQRRGLADQFYKEYSYWIRNARIVNRTVRMELAQLLAIDKTKRVTVGDVTGFVRKMQYSVSNKSGLGTVTMEIMYI